MAVVTPRTGAEVTPEWVKAVVEGYEAKKKEGRNVTFTPTEFVSNKATKPGENFNSELTSIEIRGQILDGKEVEENQYSLILKFHSLDLFSKEMNKYVDSHIKELSIYSEVHRKLTDFQKESGKSYELKIPEFYYGCNEGDDFVIVMRNLKVSGFVNADKKSGLNYPQLRLAISQLARWHGLAYVYNKKAGLLKEYPHLLPTKSCVRSVTLILEIAMKGLDSLIAEREEFMEFRRRLRNWKEVSKKIINYIFAPEVESQSICTLIHGDFWINNILYLFDDDKATPKDISILDWQMCNWSRAVIDLHYLFYSSTTYEVRKEHLKSLLQEYCSIFEEITMSFNSPVPGLTFDSFLKEFYDASIIGLAFGSILVQGTLSKAGEKVSAGSFVKEVNVRSFSYGVKNKIVRMFISLAAKPSMTPMMKILCKKMFDPIVKEVQEGSNEVVNTRLLGILQEHLEIGTLDDITPVD